MLQKIKAKIQSWEQARRTVEGWKRQGLKVVFTNGCFDLLHYGHIHYLAQAREQGERLVIGLNSDASVRRLKGPNRPINDEPTRQLLLAALECVDLVTTFEQDTPLELISLLLPDVLVKGGDYRPEDIVGADVVLAQGGEVKALPYIEGHSTTAIEAKIREKDS
ncbi:MAG: D-glycero-beta-D-manno-heptose 1-phosphate adenylyltransferase [Lewinellaceae bacterium]|nr:D-glycero-beta-D-manno-heptose 1-phosphate adenylyltransferase [Phaeodactylibacter sp.]MCB9347228.1 D-glycero-beta-D-manno-heptose 1-phosphate adenylyltransferase [Lewinellaceae bacterium]